MRALVECKASGSKELWRLKGSLSFEQDCLEPFSAKISLGFPGSRKAKKQAEKNVEHVKMSFTFLIYFQYKNNNCLAK